jgi:hypothetical protein
MIRIAAGHRMIFELAEMARERHVFGARQVLIAEEQDLVGQQQRPDGFHQFRITRRNAQVDVDDFRADRAGQRRDLRGRLQYGRRRGSLCCRRHGSSSTVCCYWSQPIGRGLDATIRSY